jgi:hypothetical protein
MREAPPSTPAPPRPPLKPPLKPPARNRQQRAPCHCGTSAGESKARNDAQLHNERRRPLRLASPSQPAPISLSVHALVVAALDAGTGRPKPVKPPPRDDPACSKQRTTICNDQCPSARSAPASSPARLCVIARTCCGCCCCAAGEAKACTPTDSHAMSKRRRTSATLRLTTP